MTERESILARIEALRAGNQGFCVGTVVRTVDATSAKPGAKAIVTSDGQVEGYVGGGCVTTALKKAGLVCIESGEPQLIRVKPEAADGADGDGAELYNSGCPSGGTVDLFLEPMRVEPRLLVVGDSPVARAVCALARQTGYTADTVHVEGESFVDSDGQLVEARARDAVAVITQGRGDRAALITALASAAAYVGMVGSQRKIASLKERIGDEIAAARLDELHGPMGIDIGAIAPEEIALSIVAEIVAYRRRGNAMPAASDESIDAA